MPDIWMDVDTALAEVPINIFPLIDDTDFKTIEAAVAYNETGLALIWNFCTTAGAQTATSVTPTSGGDYDWTDQGTNGLYSIEIPASGGASANNDTEGFGWFTGVAEGILPWRGPVIGFRAAGLNNILIDSAYSATRGLAGTALPDAAADAAGGLPISDAGGLDLDAMNTNINDIETDTGTTLPATLSTIEGKIDTVDTNVDTILVDTADMQPKIGTPVALDGGAATLGGMLTKMADDNGGADFDAGTDSLQEIRDHIGDGTNLTEAGGDGDHLTAVPWNAAWDAEVQSEVQDALEANNLDHLMKTAVANNADMTTEVTDGSVLSNIMTKGSDTSDFTVADDSLEAIRDRGDASWTSGGTSCVRDNTAQAGASGTITLDASASAVNDTYNDNPIWIYGGTGIGQVRWIQDYDGGTKVATISPNWATNPDATSTFRIMPEGRAGRALLSELPAATQPVAEPPLEDAVMLHYMAIRNNLTDDGSDYKIANDAGTVITKASVSDGAGVYTKGKLVAGP